jgi:phosphoserine phosphatase RsbU/P
VLFGTGVGLSLFFVMTLLSSFAAWLLDDPTVMLVMVNLMFLGLLLSPVTFAYAFGRYRLLDVEARLRRGTRYAISIGLLFTVLAVAIYAGSALLQKSVFGRSSAVVLMVAAAVGLVPGLSRIRKVLENRFYPERQRLRDMLHDFLHHTFTVGEGVTFWDQLEEHLREGLMVEAVHPILLRSGSGAFLYRDQKLTPFHARSGLSERLERERRPIMVDEIAVYSRVQIDRTELEWLTERRIAVVLPLIVHSRLIGFVGLGMKTERDDFAAEEIRLLDSLAPQIALATENIRLLEENVEKKRLEEQLQIARRIQNGFLPREIPDTPGLDVAVRYRFCLEVAGDYYDIIPLPGGQTMLAVGDVSGKGAGAALLMANLQASLRTAAGVGARLTDIVARINDLICRNTPPEEFITFFAAVFDPVSSNLTYVNAGHNPPLLLRENGSILQLDVGGLILGMTPCIQYLEDTVRIERGDLLLLYTDGVSEAMDAAEVEFGVERMVDIARKSTDHRPTAVLDAIDSRVLAFHGSDILEDDYTLLLARAT